MRIPFRLFRRLVHKVLLASVLFLASAILAAEDYDQWSHSMEVILDTSPGGADVASTVTGFPVLIRLQAADFKFSESAGRGRDIRILDAAGALLPHQIESWDSGGARASIWVRVGTIQGNTPGQVMRMLWGNPAAAEIGNGAAVFPASEGYLGVWHLGGPGTTARPNAVGAANPAKPGNFEGKEGRPGLIGACDSLDGADDHLSLGEGFEDFSGGFTFSIWAFPTAIMSWARLLDLGNGTAKENILVARFESSNKLYFHSRNPEEGNMVSKVDSMFVSNQWQHISVTFSGGRATTFRNGNPVRTDTGLASMAKVKRISNFLGRSNWTADEYFQGKLDEATISSTARSAAWIRLGYQNQKTGQSLVRFRRSAACSPAFAVSKDTTVSEGGKFEATAVVECAQSFGWSVAGGPAPKILDPATKHLTATAPRIAGDTLLEYRFTADFQDSQRIATLRVMIKEAIPDPQFTLPESLQWDGSTPLSVRPTLLNLPAIRASRDSILHYAWRITPSDWPVDTLCPSGALSLQKAGSKGSFKLELCLDNSWLPVCRSLVVNVSGTLSLSAPPRIVLLEPGASRTTFDANGRLHPLPESPPRSRKPIFSRNKDLNPGGEGR